MQQLVRNVRIIGTGSHVPETVYTNEYLDHLSHQRRVGDEEPGY